MGSEGDDARSALDPCGVEQGKGRPRQNTHAALSKMPITPLGVRAAIVAKFLPAF